MKKNILAALIILFLINNGICYGQSNDSFKVESLFSESSSKYYVTRPGIQFIQIQNQVSGMIGLSSGVYFDRSFYLGLSGYVNLTHSKVNTGILGVEVEQIFNSEKMVHFGYNVFTGVGSVKDYQSKNNLFDNFLNVFGTNYFFAQPSLIVGVNLIPNTEVDFGIGYRFVAGLNERSDEISITNLKNRELNNYSIFISFKFFDD